MPATQRGHARKLPSGKWQLRYRDTSGAYKTGGVFRSKTGALDALPRRRRAEAARPKRPS